MHRKPPLQGKLCPYWVEDGSQYDLVGAALQDDLHVSLEQAGLGEELGLCRKGLWRLCAIGLPSEHWTLESKRGVHGETLKTVPR